MARETIKINFTPGNPIPSNDLNNIGKNLLYILDQDAIFSGVKTFTNPVKIIDINTLVNSSLEFIIGSETYGSTINTDYKLKNQNGELRINYNSTFLGEFTALKITPSEIFTIKPFRMSTNIGEAKIGTISPLGAFIQLSNSSLVQTATLRSYSSGGIQLELKSGGISVAGAINPSATTTIGTGVSITSAGALTVAGAINPSATTTIGTGVSITSAGVVRLKSGVNADPVTTGITQGGLALRIQGGDNAVIDFGTNSTNTWIQATDLNNLESIYTLRLNPNGGLVKIGTGVSITSAGALSTSTLKVGSTGSTITKIEWVA